jgi:hypothetical protein
MIIRMWIWKHRLLRPGATTTQIQALTTGRDRLAAIA